MTTIKFRRGTAAQWTSANPVLTAGEPGFETDTNKGKIGDGTTAWTSLPYSAEREVGQRVQAAGGVVTPGQNTIAGYSGNGVASDLGTTTINGGGTVGRENIIGATDFSTVGTATSNVKATGSGADYSVITGGYDNMAGGLMSVISGAHNYTTNTSTHGTISGGSLHHIDAGDYHTIAGGTVNSITTTGGSRCTIGGGADNSITGTISGAAIAGGRSNIASASQAFIGAGLSNSASGDRSVIGGGNVNTATAQFSAVLGGSGNNATGQRSSVGGGSGNTASGQNASVGGGGNCQANTSFSSVAGGELNTVNTSSHGTVAGGKSNAVTGLYAAIGGGDVNTASGANAFVVGSNNTGSGAYSTAAGVFAIAANYGENAESSGRFAAAGDAQRSRLGARRATTDATPTELRLDGGSTRLVLADNSCYRFTIEVAGLKSDGSAGCGFEVRGTIRRGSGAASVALVGTNVSESWIDTALSGAAFAATADTTNGALSMTVTGVAATSIRWNATIRLTKVSF